ncbi:hypothetical protein EZJ49_07225 [Bdellovibrio bacteriovorus]|uniref:hypothetical protein n=1 Tax=Bdellovibrio bacteriovorus TaxID=959 RepID=UPI0021D1C9FC|nr:hypothetical protein [Bdellovibrio bacteriovorus]UXR66038.1 hypothetical protein EZJ49_07225 [Bdellovibrio bacteriovorus]
MFGTAKKDIVGLWLLSLLVLSPLSAQAVEWQMSLQHAGFMGEASVAAGFENQNRWFGLDLGVGFSSDSDGKSVRQLNLKARLQPFIRGVGKYGEVILPYVGVQAMYTDDTAFFVKSGSEFPEEEYYDFTAIRFGIPLGMAWRNRTWSVYAEYVLLDTDLIAQYNTEAALKYQDITSASIGLRYYF